MRAWWLLAFFTRFAGAAPDLLFHAPDGRVPTFAPRPPVPNPVDDPDWLVAASGFCSDFSSAPDGSIDVSFAPERSIDFKFHPEVSVAFTDAPFHQAASLEDGIEIRGEEYSQTDVLAAGTWTNKNIALLEPTSSCDDPPAGSQDEWAVSVFKVTGNEACGEECVHFSGLVSGASDNFVARKEGRFLCQLFVESHTFSDQARRSLRRRLAPTPLMTNMHMQPTARQPAFAPVPDIDLTASWLVATAGICSDLTVTTHAQYVPGASAADQSGTFESDITFKFHPKTSVAFTKSPAHRATDIGDGIEIQGKEYSQTDVLSSAVWNLKNIALLEPTSLCDDPPAGSQDEWGTTVFKITSSSACGDGIDGCVLYNGMVSGTSSNLVGRVEKSGRFPCQMYVDSGCGGCSGDEPYCNTKGINHCTNGKDGARCADTSECASETCTFSYPVTHGQPDTCNVCTTFGVNECKKFNDVCAKTGEKCSAYKESENMRDGDANLVCCNGRCTGGYSLTQGNHCQDFPPSPPPHPPPSPPQPPPLAPPPPSPPASCGQLDCDLPPGLCNWTASEAPLITILTYDGPTKYGPVKEAVDQECPQYYRDVKDAAECEMLAVWRRVSLRQGRQGRRRAAAAVRVVRWVWEGGRRDPLEVGERAAEQADAGPVPR